MQAKLSPVFLALMPFVSPLALFPALLTSSAASANQVMDEVIEVRSLRETSVVQASSHSAPHADISEVLRSLPGADINRNGPLTGIAQYRGLYGDRVHVSIDGQTPAGAGPNAMDTPLSYAGGILTQSLEVDRGIAPVSRGTDTLGGSVRTSESQAMAGEVSGRISGQYQANGEQYRLGAKTNLGGDNHALLLYGETLQGDDAPETGASREILPGVYDKTLAGAKYRYYRGDSFIGLGVSHLETLNSATPALPMDIDYIRTDRFKLEGRSMLAADWQLDWELGYNDARHGMDNYSLRMKMPSMAPRYNSADAQSWQGKFTLGSGDWLFGADFSQATHDSVITEPGKPMFRVDNFAGVEDASYSLFAQWQTAVADWQWLLGARVKHYRFDADEVSHSMAAMKPAIAELMRRYNSADRSQSDTGFDLVANGRKPINDDLSLIVGLAHKQASASYQQRYLWVPMQSTGGLADGRTYVGDMDLELETAWQLELGLELNQGNLALSPRLFINRIDNYIQGLPTDDAAILAAGDANTLVFSNTDALLYGMDVTADWQLTEVLSLDVNALYVRGERRDVKDDLYRIAPPSIAMGLEYRRGDWFARLQGRAVAAQDKVSEVQQERSSSGYATVDVAAGWESGAFAIKAGVDNLFDIEYADHLAGYNRVAGGDIAMGERMPQPGLNAWVMADYRF